MHSERDLADRERRVTAREKVRMILERSAFLAKAKVDQLPSSKRLKTTQLTV